MVVFLSPRRRKFPAVGAAIALGLMAGVVGACAGDDPPPAAAPGGFCEALADLGGPSGNDAEYFEDVAALADLAPTVDLSRALATMGKRVRSLGGASTDANRLWSDPEFVGSVTVVSEFWVAECAPATSTPTTGGDGTTPPPGASGSVP